MFFPVNPVDAITSANSLALQAVFAKSYSYSPIPSINVTTSGLLQITNGLTIINFSSGLSVTGILESGAGFNFKVYNRGNSVTLVNLSAAVAQNFRMILPSGASTVLGNNQWAEFFLDSANGNLWRVML